MFAKTVSALTKQVYDSLSDFVLSTNLFVQENRFPRLHTQQDLPAPVFTPLLLGWHDFWLIKHAWEISGEKHGNLVRFFPQWCTIPSRGKGQACKMTQRQGTQTLKIAQPVGCWEGLGSWHAWTASPLHFDTCIRAVCILSPFSSRLLPPLLQAHPLLLTGSWLGVFTFCCFWLKLLAADLPARHLLWGLKAGAYVFKFNYRKLLPTFLDRKSVV